MTEYKYENGKDILHLSKNGHRLWLDRVDRIADGERIILLSFTLNGNSAKYTMQWEYKTLPPALKKMHDLTVRYGFDSDDWITVF